MPRQQTPNLSLQLSLPSSPQWTSGVEEHWGPVMDANLAKIDAALAATATVTLTAAQILAMDNTVANGVVLVPAPGPGKAILVWQVWANLQFRATPYATSTGNLALFLKSGASYVGSPTTILTSAQVKAGSSQLGAVALSPNLGGVSNVSQVANASICIGIDTATKFTAGDSKVVVGLTYSVIAAV